MRIVPSSSDRVNAYPGTEALKSSALRITFVSKTKRFSLFIEHGLQDFRSQSTLLSVLADF